MLPYLLIGNPENRRVTLFQEALAELGQPAARVISWLDLATNGSDVLADVDLSEAIVRIDSAGESFEVERAFLRLGFEAAAAAGYDFIQPEEIGRLAYDRGRIIHPRQAHLGFLQVLEGLRPVFASRPGWRLLTPLEEIPVLFDKRLTSRRYESLGIPVPPRLDGIEDVEDLDRAMEARAIESVFVKLSCSSSASCLAVYFRRRGASWLMTTIEQAPTGWYNSLRVRRVERPDRVAEVLGYLLRNGAQIEEAVPKARLDRAFFDCRVVVIGGGAEFVVVRQNRHPITNLHLGGWRGSLEQLEREAGTALEAGLESCRRAAESHGCFCLGVDLMFEPSFRGHRILESNAFGDLLPNLTRNGRTVYGRQIEVASALAPGSLLRSGP